MSHLGSVVLKTIFLTFFALLLGYLFLGTFPSLNLFSALGVLITFVLAIIINCLLTQSIALFSFSIEDATPFYWLYSKFILIVGTTFPIEYFPKIIQPLLNLSPIYAAVYGPAKLFVKFSLNTFLNVILMQIIYLILSYGLCTLLYKKGVKKLNVNGG